MRDHVKRKILRSLVGSFFDIHVIVYSLSHKDPLKERLSNPYTSIFGLGLNSINGYHSAMVISHDTVILHILLITPLITLCFVCKDLLTPYH